MQAQIHHPWESTLLSLAHEARHAGIDSCDHRFDRRLLADAYAYCEALTAYHSRSFHTASGLLPHHKRLAVRALYAFCRVTDDIVDREVEKAHGGNGDNPPAESSSPISTLRQLEQWRKRIAAPFPPADDLVAVAWVDARRRNGVPWRYAEQLIDGVARDLTQRRYQTFGELAAYSYGVASTVGLMSMHIIGYAGQHAIPYAIKLGVALQVTNILRDVAEDWRAGRLYLPQEELARFEIDESEIGRGQVTERWRNFMRFQIERNRRLYREAWPGVALLNADGRFAIAAAADLYQGILDDIEKHDYDVFTRRAHLGKWQKISRLPGIWWRSRTA